MSICYILHVMHAALPQFAPQLMKLKFSDVMASPSKQYSTSDGIILFEGKSTVSSADEYLISDPLLTEGRALSKSRHTLGVRPFSIVYTRFEYPPAASQDSGPLLCKPFAIRITYSWNRKITTSSRRIQIEYFKLFPNNTFTQNTKISSEFKNK